MIVNSSEFIAHADKDKAATLCNDFSMSVRISAHNSRFEEGCAEMTNE